MFQVRDEGPVEGLADLIPEPADDDDRLAPERVDEITERINRAELPLQATMGLPESWQNLIDRVFFRRLVRELPAETRAVPWLECHVPPGGTTTIRSRTSMESSGGLGLKLFGSGLGRGRRVAIGVSTQSHPRRQCARYLLDVEVKPRLFESRGIESVEIEVLACHGDSVRILNPCQRCGVDPGSVDPFDFDLGPHLDRRQDTVATIWLGSLEVAENLAMEAGFSVGGLDTQLTLSATVTRSTALEVESELPPGHLYQLYRALATHGPLQTPMWAVSS